MHSCSFKNTTTSSASFSLNGQKRFATDVVEVITVLREKGNPYLLENGPRLKSYSSPTGEVMEDEQSKVLCSAPDISKTRHATYRDERLIRCVVPITDVIPLIKIPTFTTHVTVLYVQVLNEVLWQTGVMLWIKHITKDGYLYTSKT